MQKQRNPFAGDGPASMPLSQPKRIDTRPVESLSTEEHDDLVKAIKRKTAVSKGRSRRVCAICGDPACPLGGAGDE